MTTITKEEIEQFEKLLQSIEERMFEQIADMDKDELVEAYLDSMTIADKLQWAKDFLIAEEESKQ